jgi:hypothetical protein
MNNSTMQNEIEISKLYERIGSTWILDGVYIFITAPIGFIGTVLNLFSFLILIKIKMEQTMLYSYLAFYSLNGLVICFIISLVFICYSPRYYPYYLSYFSRLNRAYLVPLVSTFFYFIGNILDIIIAIDRLSIFVKFFKPFSQLNFYLVCLLTISLSLIINIPHFFLYYTKDDYEFFNEIKYNLSTFTYTGRTNFFYSKLGVIITYLQVFIRDIMTLFFEFIISTLAFYYLRKFNNKLIKMNRISSTINPNRFEILRKKIIKDRQMLLLNLIQTFLSFISHILVCMTYFYAAKGVNEELFYWMCVGYFAVCFKHFCTFFILYFFNSNFKNQLSNLLGLKLKTSE